MSRRYQRIGGGPAPTDGCELLHGIAAQLSLGFPLVRKDPALSLAREAYPDDSAAQTALSWTLRRILPRGVDAAAVIEVESRERLVAAMKECVLYRFSLARDARNGSSAVEYRATVLGGFRGSVRAMVAYHQDAWSGPVADTKWSFALGDDDVLEFVTTHSVYAHPEGAEALARLIADAMGRPVHGEPSDR